ncbi:uncharacterized protein LOC110349017 [Heterocephalus glaber]|uniref:Uncharacterized protein LOC110349017 n=1 Tax=Heterocephalus glaber TaxID=10181 RepID=A0AAX6SWN9_HETGA|nr:uncharacterized protein LOC110349017 [Heterocephalus glaber]
MLCFFLIAVPALTSCLFDLLCSFPGVKQHIYTLTVFLFSSVAWVLGIALVSSISWCMWEFDNQVVPIAFIGLWDAQYYVRQNNSGTVVDVPVDASIHRGWTQATELDYAKGLMVLVDFMQPASLILSTVAFLVSRLKPTYSEFLSSCVALAVSWNYANNISGQRILDFPLEFTVDKESGLLCVSTRDSHCHSVPPQWHPMLWSHELHKAQVNSSGRYDLKKAQNWELGCVRRPEHRVLEEIAT